MSYGLTLTGFVPKTLVEAKAELDALFKATFGAQLGSEPDGSIPPDSVAGQFVGLLSDREAEIWEVMQAVSSSFDPDNATGKPLNALCAITGTIRNPERHSLGSVVLTGDPGTVLAAGRIASVLISKARFETLASVTLALAPTWATATPYALGARVTNGAAPPRIYEVVSAGTSAAIGTGPAGTGSAITDNTIVWAYCGDGTASAASAVQSVEAGAYAALAGTLTEIETPVTGWLGVRNLADVTIGSAVEGDPALRIRRENELSGNGNGTLNALRAKLLRVGQGTANPVVDCTVFENTTMVVDADGVPPKAFEALVLGGDQAAILQTIFDTKPLGIEAFGSTSGVVTDSAGNPHTIKFSRPTEVLIWVEIDITKNPAKYPLDGDAQCLQAVLDWHTPANGYSFGKDATVWGVATSVYRVPGVLKVTAVRIGTAPAPVGVVDIPIGIRQIARFDSARTLITSVNGTP